MIFLEKIKKKINFKLQKQSALKPKLINKFTYSIYRPV